MAMDVQMRSDADDKSLVSERSQIAKIEDINEIN